MTGYALTYIACGFGLDSTALLLASEKGLHGVPRADLAIFADTAGARVGHEWDDVAEPSYVYEHIWRLAERAAATPGAIPIHIASAPVGLMPLLVERITRLKNTTSQPPLWTRERTGMFQRLLWGGEAPVTMDGQLPRACTRDFKILISQRYIRRLLGLDAFRAGGPRVLALMGIAADEVERVNVSREAWCDLAHPFVDAGVTKAMEADLLREHGWAVPKKSSCVFCPYHSDEFHADLKANHPEDFEKACLADEALRRFPRMRSDLFVHRSRRPLREVKFADAPAAFGNDCSGMCSS